MDNLIPVYPPFNFIERGYNNLKVDLLIIMESKLNSTFPDAQFNVDRFCIYRQDYTTSSGGILVYMRSDRAHHSLIQHEINMGSFESMCIEVNNKKLLKVYFCFWFYLPKTLDQNGWQTDIAFIGDINCWLQKSGMIKEFWKNLLFFSMNSKSGTSLTTRQDGVCLFNEFKVWYNFDHKTSWGVPFF